MWFGRVLINLHKFHPLGKPGGRLLPRREARRGDPDRLPGLPRALAKRAKRRGIPVIYFVPPQILGVGRLAHQKGAEICGSCPVQPAVRAQWYHDRGVPGAVYIGHPYFDELTERTLDGSFLAEQKSRGGPVVAILPGSRTQELKKNLPTMLQAAALVARDRVDARFVVACLHERHRELAHEIMQESGITLDSLQLHAARTPELIRLADVAWAVSGFRGAGAHGRGAAHGGPLQDPAV